MASFQRRNIDLAIIAIVAAAGSASACAFLPSSCDDSPELETRNITISPDEACALAKQWTSTRVEANSRYIACPKACSDRSFSCQVDERYARAFGDANQNRVAKADAPANCPVAADKVAVICQQYDSSYCEGRRTDGVAELAASVASLGSYFATCAYLEATSVLAFERMHAELEAHLAPHSLLQRVRQAQREEVRHTELTSTLARAYGAVAALPERPALAVRALFDIALENAVEGCVRETYGATMALMRSEHACSAEVREAAREIAVDEMRHAQLAWDVADWLNPRLSENERKRIRLAMQEAVRELMTQGCAGNPDVMLAAGMPTTDARARVVAQLDARIFLTAAA